jgi:hypothetical protein
MGFFFIFEFLNFKLWKLKQDVAGVYQVTYTKYHDQEWEMQL